MKKESETKTEQLLKGKVEIDKELCKGCGYCVITCPKNVINIGDEINGSGYFYAKVLNPAKCTGCALCAEICPDIAITVWRKVLIKDSSQEEK